MIAVQPVNVADELRLTGITAFGHHGVFEHERRDGQQFRVDVTCSLDLSTAASSDEVSDTVDYGTLAHRIAQAISTEPVNLIETLADRIAQLCLADPKIANVEVTVHKPTAPISVRFDDVSVTLRRERTIDE